MKRSQEGRIFLMVSSVILSLLLTLVPNLSFANHKILFFNNCFSKYQKPLVYKIKYLCQEERKTGLAVTAPESGAARKNTIKDGGEPSTFAPGLFDEPPAASVQWNTVILADPTDPYYALAEEIAQHETLPIVSSLDAVMALDPIFLLWTVSPSRLSDEVMVDFGLAMRDRQSAISVGIISGTTLEKARELWQRALEVKGKRLITINAANPSGHIEPKITIFDGGETRVRSLTKVNLKHALQNADYLTFTGHGGWSYLRLDDNTKLSPADIPRLPSIVIGTGSCNTFRIWENNSIVLAFASRGAAAYAGFAYSPNEGYLMGEFNGLPFCYTRPDFPIGHIIQVQNHGTLQGFARFPYYYLLGDPRIALQAEVPYHLVDDQEEGNTRTLAYTDAPAGFIPVRIPAGAKYSFVEISGVTAAWDHDQFYNSRLQMVNIKDDKYILFDHKGGDFTLHLRLRPHWYWIVTDLLFDALDHTLLYIQQTGGLIISLFAAGIALIGMVWFLLRRKGSAWTLAPAALTGIGFAALQGLYTLTRLNHVTITSKLVEFSPLNLASTFLLTGFAAFLFLNAKSRLAKGIAVFVAAFPALAATALGLGIITMVNTFYFKPKLGVGLYNYAIGLLPLGTLVFECILFGLTFFILHKWIFQSGQSMVQ